MFRSANVGYTNCIFFCCGIQINLCTQHVLNLYFSCNSMNSPLSYYGLIGARMKASDNGHFSLKNPIKMHTNVLDL